LRKLDYKTLPDHQNKSWPSGIKYIIGNEGCERFSYYGMNAILYIYCVTLFVSNSLSQEEASNMATSTVHLFKTGVYAFPMIGAIIADRFLGKYNTILYLSLVYCLGHVVLSFTEGSIYGMAMGLGLIAIGSGGIKPCVSAHVGDQFGKSNWNLLEKVYQMFYFIINFGSFFAVLLIPLVKEWFGWRVAFLIPGVLMFIATFIFWLGRKSFVHIPASPGKTLGFFDSLSSVLLFLTFGSLFFTAQKSFLTIILVSLSCFVSGLLLFFYRQKLQRDDGFLSVSLFMAKDYCQNLFYKRNLALAYVGSNSGPLLSHQSTSHNAQREFGDEAVEGVKAVGRIISIFIMVSIFWALFDQHSSSWIRQAEMMDLSLYLPIFGEITMLSSQIPSLNPIMVMALIPFWAYVVEPFLSKLGINMTPLKKMTLGMLLASFSFVTVALLQGRIDADPSIKIHVLWQIIPYLLITTSEVLVSITGLEFAYSQAPKRMKSTVMGFWLLSVALGNVLVALLARFSHLALENFFWLFALLMALAGLVFAIRAKNYQVKDYTQ
jgi:POT family proton-dependent oligopeptide transporter